MKNLLTFLFFLLIYVSNSHAADVTFTGGAGNSLWQESANWDSGSVPDATSNVIIPAGMSVNIFNGTMAYAEDLLLSGSLFINGTLLIENGTNGLRSGSTSAELEINGSLKVNQVNGPGLRMNAELTVNNGGSIVITNLTGTEAVGFSVRSGVNNGEITIDNVGANAMRFSHDEFVNANLITIKNSTRTGLYCGSTGTFTNDGIVNIEGNKWYSINLPRGAFVNNGTVSITQSENTSIAADPNTKMIRVVESGAIYNHGIFNVEYIGDKILGDIENDNIIRNEECGEMYLVGVSGSNSFEMTNFGFIFAGPQFAHLDNEGVLISTLNSGIDNDGVVFFEEFNDYEVGVPVNGFMSGNLSIEFADELFIDEALTISAGELFNNEVWLPSAAAGGKNVFYADVSTGSCNKVIEINLGNSVVTGTNIFLASSGLWSNDANWSLGHVPLLSEKCIVTSDTDTIIVDIDAQVVDIDLEADIIIESDVVFNISGAEDDGIVFLNGELTNNGEIIIDKCGRSGLRGSTNSTIKNMGSISVSNTKYRGVESDSIYNVGSISSDGSYKAGVRATKFYNDGDIDISNVNDPLSIGFSGIYIGGLETGWNFYNGINGEIEISNVDEAFINCEIQQAGSNSTFDNAGKITATGSNNYGWIINGATISNENTGYISLSDVKRGNITVDNGDFSRLDEFYNHGHLKVFDSGLLFKSGANITEEYGGLIVKNGGHFVNESCGVLESDDYLELITSGSFENEGTIISHNDYLNVVTAIFTNKGTIVDYGSAWNGIFFFNEQYKLESVTDQLTVEQPVDIFDVGTIGSNIISNFYADSDLNELVAIYDNETDLLTPLEEAEGLTSMYFQVLYNFACRDTIEVKLDLAVLGGSCKQIEWVGSNNGAWSKAINWDQGYVPGACDNVIIDNGTTVIVNDNFYISHIELINSQLIIDNSMVLNIFSGSDVGLTVNGNSSVENNGDLLINTYSIGIELNDFIYEFKNYHKVIIETNDRGLLADDEGSITNYAGSTFSVFQNEVGGRAIELRSADTYYDNLGSTYLQNFQDGFYLNNGAYLYNSGSMLIEDTNFGMQLYNGSFFDNEQDMEMFNIGVTGFTLSGSSRIRNFSNSYTELETKRIGINIGSNASVENSGDVVIGGQNDLYGIVNTGLLINKSSADLNIADFQNYGLFNSSTAILQNEGVFKIANTILGQEQLYNLGSIKLLAGKIEIKD